MSSYSYKKHKRTKHSKKSKHYVRRKSRKMGGGGDIGVDIKSGSEYRYINPINTSQISGCRSDNTTGVGAYYLNTPSAVGGQSGGSGSVCTQNPYQFSGGKSSQMGGGRRKGKGRRMKGGDGSFWNFSKIWNPVQGGNVLALSERGISPSGVGSPVTTAGNRPMPPFQAWPAKNLIMPNGFTRGGGMQMGGGGGGGGGKYTRKGKGKGKSMKKSRGRGKRGGNIIDDVQMMGRDIVHRMGSVVNGFSGFDNKIYNANPSPMVQLPRGLGSVTSGASNYSSLGLQGIYNESYASAAGL